MRWVQLQSAGVEPWLDRFATRERAVHVGRRRLRAQVAEHALALMLAGVRRLADYARARRGAPECPVLDGSTVAIVGAGGIGRALIELLEPHDVEILAVTRCGPRRHDPAERLGEVWRAPTTS